MGWSKMLAVAGLLTGLGLPAMAAEGAPFYLKNGDTVVFYGDSITEQNLYNQFVEVYAVTRFPKARVHFYGSGIGGDRVSGGWAGPIDERLPRDVFAHKPTVVTVMLGMNDASYKATTPEIESAYTTGYEHLEASLHANVPGVRVTLIGPSPFDDVTRPVTFPGGYNAALVHFSDLVKALAAKHGDSFVNFNPAVVASLEKAQALNPMAAQLLIPDRVHPEQIVHWVMAEALLKGWGAPAIVTQVTIDGTTGKAVEQVNATVSDGTKTGEGVSWTELDEGLPLAFDRGNAAQAFLLQISDIQEQLNQEPLRVTGLAAGTYTLKIDDTKIGSFSAEELGMGINLAEYSTPMTGQSRAAGWAVRDAVDAHFVHMRMQVKKAALGSPDVLEAWEKTAEDAVYDAALPKAHKFLVVKE